MYRIRTLLIGGTIAATALGALVAPAAAADTKATLAIINGIPGRTVDVCLNGNEIKSRLAYGKTVLRNVVGTGDKTLRFYATDPRACRGNVVAEDTFTLAAGDDLTIVVTKRPQKVVTFDNAGLGEIPPLGGTLGTGYLAWRHAAEPTVNFKYDGSLVDDDIPIGPSADPEWTKGDQLTSPTGVGLRYRLKAVRPGGTRVIASKAATPRTDHRIEWILVGTNARNARFVLIDRKISAPTP